MTAREPGAVDLCPRAASRGPNVKIAKQTQFQSKRGLWWELTSTKHREGAKITCSLQVAGSGARAIQEDEIDVGSRRFVDEFLGSSLSLPTIQRMEKLGLERSSAGNVERVQRALEAAGVEFTNGDAPGVRLRQPPVGNQ